VGPDSSGGFERVVNRGRGIRRRGDRAAVRCWCIAAIVIQERQHLALKEGIAPRKDRKAAHAFFEGPPAKLQEQGRGELMPIAVAHPPRSAIGLVSSRRNQARATVQSLSAARLE